MADVQPYDTEGGNETDDEYAIITELTQSSPEKFHDYSYGDLLDALRKGYELGRQDGEFLWSTE